ncbi:MAG: MBL fold metallo-hydrolase [Bacteroidales bacterium]|nr:MBL fold metallo-hydrolase [Bacteroidales bacterium]
MKITFLGTGTSQGVPVIACECNVCQSNDSKDKRLRSSVMIETKGRIFIIDTGPDFRQQMLRNNVTDITSIIFTHEHKDHVAGLDDVRAFNFKLKKHIRVYAEERVQNALKHEFAYVFADNKYPGVPQIEINLIENKPFEIDGIKIIPVRVYHHLLPVLGFRIGNFAYLTDVKTVPEEEKSKLKNLDVLVLTALRKEEHISHMNLSEALQFTREIKPNRTYLTHLSHRFGLHEQEEKLLPGNVMIAYDNLTVLSS